MVIHYTSHGRNSEGLGKECDGGTNEMNITFDPMLAGFGGPIMGH